MSDVRRIRIAAANGVVQRLTVPSELDVAIISAETPVTYYDGRSPQQQMVTTFALIVKRGDQLLARLPGVSSFRDESITVEDADVSSGQLEWKPAP